MFRSLSFLLTPVLVLAIVVPAVAEEPAKQRKAKAAKRIKPAGPEQPAFNDPAEAGPDFQIQGEYVGVVRTPDGEIQYGAQVIALGDGKFRAVGCRGGLPGAGWDKSERMEVEGQIKDGSVVFPVRDVEIAATLADGVITVKDAQGKTLGTLKKILRQSPTLGAKPPAGAVVLFDGTSADNFQGGRTTPDGLLMEGATSKQKFKNFTIHLEFRTPFMPYSRGQARGNSGYYVQGRYEIQILDSFGLESLDNECGGIYKVAKPAVNMCLPPLSWQTYDVDFTAAEFKDGQKVKDARVTIRHNGVAIHENLRLPDVTGGHLLSEGPEPGPVYLQNHRNPVRFRNIWVVE